jgi:hypothetical protein
MIEEFTKIKKGQDNEEVERILNYKLDLIEFKDEYVHYYYCRFEDIGVWLFFKIEDKKLYTIRYEYPFPIEVEGIKIGFTKKEVKKIKGKPHRKWPIRNEELDIWLYDEPEFIRFDLKKGIKGKVIKIIR